MHTDIINDYIDREVEVSTTSSKSFTGTLKHHDSIKETVTIGPTAYYAKKYGPVIIKQHDIVTIREVLPQIEEDDGYDECDSKMKSKPDYDDKQTTGQSAYAKSAADVLANYDLTIGVVKEFK